MRADNETTATQLHVLLTSCDVSISLTTIVRSQQILGWSFRGLKYCQLIRAETIWAIENLHEVLTDGFDNVTWTDETTVQLESHRTHSYKKGQPAVLNPAQSIPPKCMFGQASAKRERSTHIIIIMDAAFYIEVIKEGLLPFIRKAFPESHRFMQDNHPKHTSRKASDYFAQEGINCWKTPPESPDMNPIKNLWHELKEFIRCEVKPHTKSELISGICKFWDTVGIQKCCKYINHLNKVIP